MHVFFGGGCTGGGDVDVVGGLVRQVSLGTIRRLVEDLLFIVKKVRPCLHVSWGGGFRVVWYVK